MLGVSAISLSLFVRNTLFHVHSVGHGQVFKVLFSAPVAELTQDHLVRIQTLELSLAQANIIIKKEGMKERKNKKLEGYINLKILLYVHQAMHITLVSVTQVVLNFKEC